jgi:osmotically-inducible protein OsmY
MKSSMYLLALTVAMAALVLVNVNLFASMIDDRIEASAKQSYVFRAYLIGDDVKDQSKDGAVSLTGTVAEESHKTLARQTVANLPGVKSVDNKLEVKSGA